MSASLRGLCFAPVLSAILSCSGAETPRAAPARPAPAADPAADEARRKEEMAHRIVFADRITAGYMLLLPEAAAPPSRAEIQQILRRAFAPELASAEVELLLDFAATDPQAALGALTPLPLPGQEDPAPGPEPAPPGDPPRTLPADLLGVEFVPLKRTEAVPDAALTDRELSRALTPEERASLPTLQRVLLVRALYRNQNDVRGLRLLQGLVRALAVELGGLVHDPDTLETMGSAAFTARRLQTSRGNIADQVVVLPFPDRRHGADKVRLTTRGMRRFGSVDLELDGLSVDLSRLQQATYFLHGLAALMVRTGELDPSGLAVEAPEEIALHFVDCVDAYGGELRLPHCQNCAEQVLVHLVERGAEPQDPFGHVVARVVAPRAISGRPGYDQPSWVRQALDQVFGPPAPLDP